MEAVSEEAAQRPRGFWERLLPLRYWLGADAAGGIELGQAKTRLICTFLGLCGFGAIAQAGPLPAGIVCTAIVFPLYAMAYLVLVRRHPVPTHRRRGFAVVVDTLANIYITCFGGAFAAYAGFLFLVTIGWGLRFGLQYLFLATGIAVAGMAANLVVSPYWHANLLFGGTIVFGLIANTVNASILLGRISRGNRQLAEKVEEISRLAWQDQLTKLPNRPYFRDRLGQMLATAARSGRQVALLLFDIDGFKAVNDTLGHEAGDRLLREIAERVGRRVRQADTFARVGGDEFVVLLDIVHDKSDAIPVAETVVATIAEIGMFAEQGLRVGASVGIACSASVANRERVADELLIQADRAMYEAKRAGKGRYKFADEGR
ncbi:MAG TPA: GGDEF domain-containing protein [Burkholderiales bacterium]|nr:GGDEF domain-containing protein [Burkholderiales bacterium]